MKGDGGDVLKEEWNVFACTALWCCDLNWMCTQLCAWLCQVVFIYLSHGDGTVRKKTNYECAKIAADMTEESLSCMLAAMLCSRCGSKDSSRVVVNLAFNRGTYQFSYLRTWRAFVPLGSPIWFLTLPASSIQPAWKIKCLARLAQRCKM